MTNLYDRYQTEVTTGHIQYDAAQERGLRALDELMAHNGPGLVNVKPAELSDADRQALQNGRTLNKVWNNLTQKERDHINELAKTAQ